MMVLRALIVALACWVLPTMASAAAGVPVWIGRQTQSSTQGLTMAFATDVPVAAGELIAVVAYGASSQRATVVSDPINGSYTPAKGQDVLTTHRTRTFYVVATADTPSGTPITVTYQSATGNKVAIAVKASGLVGPTSATWDSAATGCGESSTSAGVPPEPSYACTSNYAQADNLLLAFTFVFNGNVDSIAYRDGWTMVDDVVFASVKLAVAYKIVSSAVPVSFNPDLSNDTRSWASGVSVFKATAGGPGPGPSIRGRRALLGVGR